MVVLTALDCLATIECSRASVVSSRSSDASTVCCSASGGSSETTLTMRRLGFTTIVSAILTSSTVTLRYVASLDRKSTGSKSVAFMTIVKLNVLISASRSPGARGGAAGGMGGMGGMGGKPGGGGQVAQETGQLVLMNSLPTSVQLPSAAHVAQSAY